MRRRSRLPTPSNVRNNKTAQEDVPIEGARLEALRAHAKRSVAASHAAAAAPPKAPWSEAATALLSICFFVALCVMGFWLEGDLESARKRQAGDCASSVEGKSTLRNLHARFCLAQQAHIRTAKLRSHISFLNAAKDSRFFSPFQYTVHTIRT